MARSAPCWWWVKGRGHILFCVVVRCVTMTINHLHSICIYIYTYVCIHKYISFCVCGFPGCPQAGCRWQYTSKGACCVILRGLKRVKWEQLVSRHLLRFCQIIKCLLLSCQNWPWRSSQSLQRCKCVYLILDKVNFENCVAFSGFRRFRRRLLSF